VVFAERVLLVKSDAGLAEKVLAFYAESDVVITTLDALIDPR
jgi:hypothetical protein